MDYSTLHSEIVFTGKVFNVRTDLVRSPDGREFQIDVVEHGGAVALIPIQADHSVTFVRQYRHPIGEWLLELPAGTLDPGEDAEEAAFRECREEIGLAPAELIHLGATYLAPGYSSEFLHYYLARQLTPAPLPQDEDEDLRTEQLSWDEAWRTLSAGGFQDAKTIVGLSLARIWLER
ncbi:MAG: NUDIX hydrolase [Anaerolineales bacterium]|jgi:ADP-ribose pyrophosphatase